MQRVFGLMGSWSEIDQRSSGEIGTMALDYVIILEREDYCKNWQGTREEDRIL